MVIEKDRMVSLTYTLRELNVEGVVIEEVDESNPLKFLFGAGQMLHEFEARIEKLKSGDSFNFSLTPDEAYGERREDLIVDIPIYVFEVNGKFDDEICKVGNQVPMADQQGRRLMGVITEIRDDMVSMDFNHPMAGVSLYFAGGITDVRQSTDEEINMYLGGENECGTCGSHSSCDGHC